MRAARPLARVFSGIQPTGIPHLGNYFGALAQWIKLANDHEVDPSQYSIRESDGPTKRLDNCDDNKEPPASGQIIKCDTPIFSIVDVHAYTSPKTQFGPTFYENILDTTASLLALGLDPKKCILFRQSDILAHNYLDNVFRNFVSTQRLSRMTQYREKTSSTSKSIPNGLLTYPVLQAADILLYKGTLVPVGEDQVQHIELTRNIARSFNAVTSSDVFPEPSSILHKSEHAKRIKSLRDPTKKMSKSDLAKKSFIEVIDEPDVLREKLKKALTDSLSYSIYYDPENRLGVSNLMRIHSLVTGQSVKQIEERFSRTGTAEYKLELADILIEKFKPVREHYHRIRKERTYLEDTLSSGRDKALPLAEETVLQVKRLLGSLGS